MTTPQQIEKFCNTLLRPENFSDYCHNGIQFLGGEKIKKIALGVSTSKIFLEQAKKWGADMTICHHGIIFGKIEKISPHLGEKIKIISDGNISVLGYHLPLDAHPEIGNNAQLCKILGIKNLCTTGIGFTGFLEKPVKFSNFRTTVQEKIRKKNSPLPFAENFGSPMVEKICIISGGASGYWQYAKNSDADTFIFGELKESDFHEMQQAKINFIAAGHYTTEKFGIQALGEKITKNFPAIETKFFEEYCPV